jgi:hypothetical protein
MYDANWHDKLRRHLQKADESNELRGQETGLLQVELGLRLLECLNLPDEPISVLWVLLSGLPIPDPRLNRFTVTQKRMVANARLLLPFHSRFGWEDALRDYGRLPEQWRAYQVQPENLDRQLVENARLDGRFAERLTVYDETLTSHLPFRRQPIPPAPLGQTIFFMVDSPDGRQEVPVTLPAILATPLEGHPVKSLAPRERRPLTIAHQELQEAARLLDEKEDKPNWVERAQKYVRHAVINPDSSLGAVNTHPLELNGMTHLVGMVGSGKSTLMSLLAAHAVLKTNWRITLVVGDTMTALSLADNFNRLLMEDKDKPVAVALLGRTTRDRHLNQLYKARDFHPNHTGLRWLSTVCPLQGYVKPDEFPIPVPVGREPCESLLEPETASKKYRTRFCCPLFHACPAQQVYGDMPDAQIWITTPGALGAASVPNQVDDRHIKLGDLIYEQSDIVIFDEVDMIQEWFDNLLAPEIKLFDSHTGGVLDNLDINVAETWRDNRVRPGADRRWRKAERHAVDAGSSILSQLEQIQLLPQWIQRNYFSALSLFFKLSRRLQGLPDYGQQDDDPVKVENAEQLFEIFKSFTADDFLRLSTAANRESSPVDRLVNISQQLIASGDSLQNPAILADCAAWIEECVPDWAATAVILQQQQQAWEERQQKSRRPPGEPRSDDLLTLAQRLEFALHVAVLDRNMRVVFYGWEQHEATDTPQPNYRAPRHLTRMLPIPPTGKLFGSYFSQDMLADADRPIGQERPFKGSRLSMFGYNNIGRWYVRHFHELRAVVEGKPGPHVLAMSGTSWLPHSSRWHFEEYGALPQGILKPAQDITMAIEQSRFTFLPQYEADEAGNLRPLYISGHLDKSGQIRKLIQRLMGVGTGRNHLQETLNELAAKADDLWQDRARLLLLVNSYAQAEVAAREIRRYASELRDQVYALVRSSDESEEDELLVPTSLQRLNIEQFKETGGKILVAPLQAIGRGYNILNDAGKAAFGTVYFLTRPMPHPYDTQAIVRELNFKTLAWCQDEEFPAWHAGTLYEKGLAVRQAASQQWRQIEQRSTYRQLSEEERLNLAATTAGIIIQACGRLLRGGVPFYGFFVDAAWAPGFAHKRELATPKTSLLAAVIRVLQNYTMDTIGEALYEPLYVALAASENFDYDF